MRARFVLLMSISMVAGNSSCAKAPEEITTAATGEVVTNVAARASGGGAPFDGNMDDESDLEDLVETAWGEGSLGLHRGHAPILGVLEAFLGISHAEMHVFMEERDLNLAGICKHFGFDPQHLVESLTASFAPFIEQAVENGVIAEDEAAQWTERVRAAFRDRVYWEG